MNNEHDAPPVLNHNGDLEIVATEGEDNIHAGVDDLHLPQDLQSMIENSRTVAGTDIVLSTPRTDYSIFMGELKHIITLNHSKS